MTHVARTMADLHRPLFDNRDLTGHLQEMGLDHITCIPHFLTEHTRQALCEELKEMALIEAEKETGPYKVRQSYRYTTDFQPESLFVQVQEALQTQLNATCARKLPGALSTPLQFTDLVVQQYDPTKEGISPHRDGLKYLNIIAVFVLEGTGRFCMCDNRPGDNPREIRNEPGDLLLMRAPGYNGEDIQPFHFVDRIRSQRTSFALRHSKLA